MINIIRFLSRHAFIVYFLVLELMSFYLLVQNNNFHRSAFINSSSGMIGDTYEAMNDLNAYLSLKKVNQRISRENAALKNQTMGAFIKTFGTSTVIHDTSYLQKYVYYSAQVLNNSTNKASNYITLDRGELHGIEPGMGVFNKQGVVGVVKDVSAHFCTVMSLLHRDMSISSRIKKNEYFGAVAWTGKNAREAVLNDIPKHVQTAAGDSVVTSGFSSVFPRGIPIGVVTEVRDEVGNNFLEIDMELTTDFKQLNYVYVVKNLLRIEQQQLEQQTAEDDH